MTPHIESVLRKAVEKLRVAEMLVANGAWDDAVSRAYYAAFHAISALHLSQGQTFSSHAQSIGRFNKDFVRSGMFSKEFTAILTRLFEDRQSGDYDVSGLVTAEDAQRDVDDARRLLEAIDAYLRTAS
ncbi:DNA-binding protein [Lamprobacter modestohalophilus]|uniref:DNA-binding protein n=1 Tax=Lamprobacter modestohalophilus TaxID=1064514 RepID=A0A9X0WCF2_9GAMM|nr:HEPN domain-containing protein [Lamprobacter modestohalophilus]MBK1621010.1 DNA-binding protein [Lamprobacter modestohalophilus]